LKSVSAVVSRIPRWLNTACESVMAPTPHTCDASAPLASGGGACTPSNGSSDAATNWYVPTLMAASTVTSPARLNHAVAQPQPRPPRMNAQWYSPPAVGNAEPSCAIVSAKHRVIDQHAGQPSPIAAPPSALRPCGNDVTQPAKTQMIENEIAKFE